METKLGQRKPHRSIKKATRRREDNLPDITKEEASPEKVETMEEETPTKEDSVQMVEPPAEEIMFVREDTIQAEKEAKVTEKKLANLTKEPTPKEGEERVEEDSMPTAQQKQPSSKDSTPTEIA